MSSLPWKTAIVVGASSGIGKALAEQLMKAGVSTALVARRRGQMEEIVLATPHTARALVYEHDVKEYMAVPELFQKITQDLGGLDLIIYASGVMPSVDDHEYNFTKDRAMFEVNTVGAAAWLDEAAHRFELTKQGTIVGISSIAGERGRRGNPAYCSSKAALSAFLEALRCRLSRFGVTVVTIKPGFIDTDMTRGKAGIFWLISADEAAKEILSAAKSKKANAFIPARWSIVAFVLRHIPASIFKHLPV